MIRRDGSLGFRVLAGMGLLVFLLAFGVVLHGVTHWVMGGGQ